MDTSFLAGGPITWATLFAFAAFVVGLLKAVDWIAGKLKMREKEAVSPLVLDLASVKLNLSYSRGQWICGGERSVRH